MTKGGKKYRNDVCTFSIDVKTLLDDKGRDFSYCYSWQFLQNDKFTSGRKPEKFFELLNEITNDKSKRKLVVYVWWLGYAYNVLKDIFSQNGFMVEIQKTETFPIIISNAKVEFRCAYMLSNKSLEEMKAEINTEEEENVNILSDWIKNYMITGGFTLNNMPCTPTNALKKEIEKEYPTPWRRQDILQKNYVPDWDDEYTRTFESAFWGGLMTGNDNYLRQKMENCDYYDICSAYIAQAVYCKFPTRFKRRTLKDTKEKERFLNMDNVATVATYTFTNLIKKEDAAFCYLPQMKADNKTELRETDRRIKLAKKLKITMYNSDFEMVRRCYDFETVEINDDVYIATGYISLPRQIIALLKKLFEKKTSLKGVDKAEYARVKIILNSFFGLCGRKLRNKKLNSTGISYEYNNPKNSFLYYPWGSYISAQQRYRLASIALEMGDDFLYCNTDSIICKSNKHTKEVIDNFNNNLLRREDVVKAFTASGNELVLGIFEHEHHCDVFRYAGTSRYYYTENGTTSIVMSGVIDAEHAIYTKEDGALLCTIDDVFDEKTVIALNASKEYISSDDTYINTKLGVTVHHSFLIKRKDLTLNTQTSVVILNIK